MARENTSELTGKKPMKPTTKITTEEELVEKTRGGLLKESAPLHTHESDSQLEAITGQQGSNQEDEPDRVLKNKDQQTCGALHLTMTNFQK